MSRASFDGTIITERPTPDPRPAGWAITEGRRLRRAQQARLDAQRAKLTTPAEPVDPHANLPEVMALRALRARLAAGEQVTEAALTKAVHAAEFARLAAQGSAERERQAAETAKWAEVDRLVAELEDPAARRDRDLHLLELHGQAAAAVRAVADAAAAATAADQAAIHQLWGLVGEPTRMSRESLVLHLRDRLAAAGRTADLARYHDPSWTPDLVAHAIGTGLRGTRIERQVGDKVRSQLPDLRRPATARFLTAARTTQEDAA